MSTFEMLQRQSKSRPSSSMPFLTHLTFQLASREQLVQHDYTNSAPHTAHTAHAGHSIAHIPIYPSKQEGSHTGEHSEGKVTSVLLMGTGSPQLVSNEEIRRTAQQGVQTPSSVLPYVNKVQQSFGRHNVSQVRAHLGTAAVAKAQAIGAAAYATGDHVVFGASPNLYVSAHEAAHVIQQRGGARPSGDVGRVGDAHEQHADQVARRVIVGQSAEDLLDRVAPRTAHASGSTSSNTPIQMVNTAIALGTAGAVAGFAFGGIGGALIGGVGGMLAGHLIGGGQAPPQAQNQPPGNQPLAQQQNPPQQAAVLPPVPAPAPVNLSVLLQQQKARFPALRQACPVGFWQLGRNPWIEGEAYTIQGLLNQNNAAAAPHISVLTQNITLTANVIQAYKDRLALVKELYDHHFALLPLGAGLQTLQTDLWDPLLNQPNGIPNTNLFVANLVRAEQAFKPVLSFAPVAVNTLTGPQKQALGERFERLWRLNGVRPKTRKGASHIYESTYDQKRDQFGVEWELDLPGWMLHGHAKVTRNNEEVDSFVLLAIHIKTAAQRAVTGASIDINEPQVKNDLIARSRDHIIAVSQNYHRKMLLDPHHKRYQQ